MTHRLVRHSDVNINRRGQLHRRDLLRALPAVGLAAGALGWTDLVSLQAEELRKKGMSCVLLWMQGGPSQFETFSPKPKHKNGGETKAISTSVAGIHYAENLPQVAKIADELCVIRSMSSKEASHPRATYLLHTGQVPLAAVKFPTLGSIVAHNLGDDQADLPSFVRIGARFQNSGSGGILGVQYDPFVMASAGRLPNNTTPNTPEDRYRRRLGLLGKLEDDYQQQGGEQAVKDHQQVYDKASRMILSPRMDAFDIEKESRTMQQAYGSSEFGRGCLMARRLLQAGVPMVEVSLGNWDTHTDNSKRSKDLCGRLDQPYAQLIRDLKQQGMLERTLVIWMGEFGRTPRINPRGGRDHFAPAFNAVLAGGGVKGGQVIGATDAGGQAVIDRRVGVLDLFQTFCHSLGIDADDENDTPIGRSIKIVDGGEVVEEVFS